MGALKQGLVVPVYAIAIAFVVLIIMLVIIRLQTHSLSSVGTKSKDSINTSTKGQEKEVSDLISVTKTDDLEFVAAIMAALCAHTGKTVSELNIKSIKRVSGNESAWRKEAILNGNG